MNMNLAQVTADNIIVKQEQMDLSDVTMVSVAAVPPTPVTSIISQPTIILATTTTTHALPNTNSKHDRLVLPKVNIKLEPQDPSFSPEYCK